MRGRDPHEAHRTATPLELLFDLTFVIAFGVAASELSHALAAGHVGVGLIGFFFATVYRRWGARGLTFGLVGFGLVLVLIIGAITRLEIWGAVAEFFLAAGVTGLTFMLLALMLAFAVAAYLPLRRSVP